MKQQFDLKKILLKEKEDFLISGIVPAFSSPDKVYLTDSNNGNLKEFSLSGGQSRVLYKSTGSINCLCQFQYPAAAAKSPLNQLVLCEGTKSGSQLAIISQNRDASFREERRFSPGSHWFTSQIHQLRNGHLILNSPFADQILEVPLDEKGNPLTGRALKVDSKFQSIECVRIGNQERILISLADQTCRSLLLDGQQLIEHSRFPVQGSVDLLWNVKTQQLLLKTGNSIESYYATYATIHRGTSTSGSTAALSLRCHRDSPSADGAFSQREILFSVGTGPARTSWNSIGVDVKYT